ncbi:hypothetical protein Rsub_03140 [Raphidocelis subcapitata]|uniref:Complex 1 LYR protein domain-containing protein n=1 Tax=Raphidocelis subcapitata TaxID=307507 RepID=A0A2V0NSC0_9CHLO|nr:hypothetical protein Rsub_03140 [Raphidocelis subcapitata]|eukprot:GBF90568.1 hypothetical protein Rsub_03140 [Raphidocelis subcapitata]
MPGPGGSGGRAIALYRRILRAARTWQGPQEERAYIESTAKAEFRRDRNLPPPEAEARLAEAEQRVDLAIHYAIPYPRLHHTPQQFKRRTYMAAPQPPPAFASRGGGGGASSGGGASGGASSGGGGGGQAG